MDILLRFVLREQRRFGATESEPRHLHYRERRSAKKFTRSWERGPPCPITTRDLRIHVMFRQPKARIERFLPILTRFARIP